MSLKGTQKRELRAVGHHLNPVIYVAEQGLTEGLIKETERALDDHELIKVKFAISDREARQQLISQLSQDCRAEVIQVIGKMALLYRAAKKPNLKLSKVPR